MIAWIVVGAVVLFFVLLLSLRVRLILTCHETVELRLKVLCFTVRLYPKPRPRLSRYSRKAMDKRERKARKKALKMKRKSGAGEKSAVIRQRKKEPSLRRKLAVIKALVSAVLQKGGKRLRLRAARLHIRVATGDAATTAVLYGAVSGALATLLALLNEVTHVKARPHDVAVIADYLHEKPQIEAKIIFGMRLGGIIATLFSAALAYLRNKQKKQIPAA